MAPRLGRRLAAMTFIGMLVIGNTTSPSRAVGPGDPATAAIEAVSAREGIAAADLQLIHQQLAPAADGVAWAGKLADRRTGDVHITYVTSSGDVVAEVPDGGSAASLSTTGVAGVTAKQDRALTVALARDPESDTTLPIAVWMDADLTGAERSVRDRHAEVDWLAGRPVVSSLEQAREIRGELWDARRVVYAQAADSMAAEIEARGGSVAYVSTSAPLLFADVPASEVAGLAAQPAVRSLGLEGNWATEMSSAGATVRADWSRGSADQGNGVRVGVVEYHNVRTTGDMAGQVVRSFSTTGRLAYGTGANDHPTWVAGAIAGLSPSFRGVAPGADIVSASTGGYSPSLATDRAIIAAADWAVAPNGGDADVINASIGQDTSVGAEEARRYFDSIAWENGRLVVAAAGNYVTFGNWDVVSPATGYNVLTVGGVNDRNTGSWSDDRLWYAPGSNGASYRDRTDASWNSHGDYNKPNLSAPAVSVRTANGMIGDGTSVASPIVAGIAAQLIARAPVLASWPEATRAVLMAGALRRTPMPDGSRSADHEGVGTADALWSNRILDNGGFGGYRVGSMSAGQVPTQSIPVIKGQRVRAVVAWSSHTSGGSNTGKADTLTADLDLRLVGPNGAVTWGATFDNSYEVVEAVAAATGTLSIQIRSGRFDSSAEPYGLAWTVSAPFVDADDSEFRGDILWAWMTGVTAGCASDRFCPTTAVTREQMASFLRRAGGLKQTARDYFRDDATSQHEGDINAVAAAGITAGCAVGRYCPRAPVTRAQMASFLVRALKLPPTATDYFGDDEGSPHEADINALAAAGVTGGCATGRFCPGRTVTRGQMAAFLHRGFGP
ncbi:MAG: S8 family peptidase [Candidatus Limnocylindria bacterium]